MLWTPTKAGIFAAGITFVFLTVVINLQSHGWWDWYRITVMGARAPAVVVSRNRAVHDTCGFEFEVDAHRYSGSQPRCGLEVGTAADAFYLPGEPSFATLHSPWSELLLRVVAPLALAAFAGLVSAWRTPRGAPPL